MSKEIKNNETEAENAPAAADEQPAEQLPAEKISAAETAARVAELDLDSDEDVFDNMQFPEPDYDAPPAVEFHDVVKSYYLYKSEKSRFKAMFTGNRGVKQHPALNGLSFTIYPGESVGFIGRNGAGKSTILKLITGVSFPTSGDITVRGKVAALLELTAGFTQDMTGRENIYTKCLLLGLTESEIQEIENDIIEFAELEEYIDQPVRTYSSGMRMRLGFSININIKPEILVIDEALSVGDSRFRKKCRNAILQLIHSGVTVLFVSHSTDALTSTCNRAIYLKDGKVHFDGSVVDALDLYNKDVEEIRKRIRERRRKKKQKAKQRLAQLREQQQKGEG